MAQAISDVPRVHTGPRLEGVDLLRGLVMVVMVLDHTRDYFADGSISPTDLSKAGAGLFLTRWVTHFCAPTFALLAGVGARLAGERGLDSGALARFLLTRGLWLIFLEQTVEKFGLLFRLNPSLLLGIVLWSIGGSFVLLSVFVAARVPARFVGTLGLVVIACHNLFDLVPPDVGGPLRPLVGFLLRPGMTELPGGMTVFIGYPLIPWFAVVAVGYWLGGVYGLEPRRRRAVLLTFGLAAIGLFVALRASNVYGDPRPWSSEADGLTTVLSFVNCTKYPPSLLYLLMTLGPALVALSAFDGGIGAIGKPLATLGRVPLFYYLLQWYVIHGLAVAVAFARSEPTGWLFIDSFPVQPPLSSSFGLPAVYGWWLVALIILYFPSAWFDRYKRLHRGSTWLSYL
ncbi:MAG: heparan-alpha-glucosaminide N-acetyltransferase domain-containing protein [Paludisphaera borealis]|uniref:DUF1624 domain-containing protein n=1 Tax=Paludisphaera borealis TaxID=1387353 RepID=UPI00284C2ACC|nr:heparan-alpha-glucosaminide N-acetyltransferase domain-containing protein [Paludisphaera borealis]MDR3618078.1 heparan-alpha-glucosaminide N-acetyltransferase domain-containing protein [Paludisphaera borealis]